MEKREFSGKTVEEATQHALDQLGVNREAVEVSVVNEGKTGILGLGSEPAVVRVTPVEAAPDGDVAGIAKSILEKLLSLMGVEGSIASQVGEADDGPGPITLDISGDDLGILIGRRGMTLSGLQYLLRIMVSHQTKSREPIVVDVEGYKQRRYRNIETFARQMGEQVKTSRKPFTFEPMSSFERRIIHVTLSDDPDLTTESMGEDEARRVVILPKL